MKTGRSNPKFYQLRAKHPELIYRSHQFKIEPKQLTIDFDFLLKPNTRFHHQVVIPLIKTNLVSRKEWEKIAFHLGLIEVISYWKLACPPKLIIQAGRLNSSQIRWWQHLFLHGLGEFFYQNQINPQEPQLLQIINQFQSKFTKTPLHDAQEKFPHRGNLVLVGGGRDSVVSLELVKQIDPNGPNQALIIQTTTALDFATQLVEKAGYPKPLIVQRRLDPKLLTLNCQGYLNGHIPISASFAFIGALVAQIYRLKNIIVANERSANEANLIYQGITINHQYSKTFEFEKHFRQYCSQHLNPQLNYFSLLRPLYELQINQLFIRFPRYFCTFLSCNLGQKTGSWCGSCPKCAFAYLGLTPFLELKTLKRIFGQDYFVRPEIIRQIYQLTLQRKPFDCVGTRDESILAFALALDKYRRCGRKIPKRLIELEKKLNLNPEKTRRLKKKILGGWEKNNFLPEKYSQRLKKIIFGHD